MRATSSIRLRKFRLLVSALRTAPHVTSDSAAAQFHSGRGFSLRIRLPRNSPPPAEKSQSHDRDHPRLAGSGTFASLIPLAAAKESTAARSADDTADWLAN